MDSLGFAILDRHVISGRADDVAVPGERPLTFARLLEQAAAVAGGLRALGVEPGRAVHVDLPTSADRVVVVCACVRLGAVPQESGSPRVHRVDDATVVTTEIETMDLVTLRRAGATDPAGSLSKDPDGFGEAVLAQVADVVTPLLAGRPAEV